MPRIDIESIGPELYRVVVSDALSRSAHEVRLRSNALERFGHGATPERLIEESFRFMLEREPKEAILSRFELPDIQRYFPEYSEEIESRLGG